jgi:hypothetical protein
LRPWIMEVNSSPALNCDAPLDLKIKDSVVTDLLNLVGFMRYDRKKFAAALELKKHGAV